MNNQNNGKSRVIGFLTIVTIIMIGVGVLMNFKLRTLLREYVEQQITEQARTFAELSAEQFELEIYDLENAAARIPADVDPDDEILGLVINSSDNITMGLLCLDGTAL